MSILNYTAATPGRVFALLRLVRELGTASPVSRETAAAWMAPEGIRTRDGKAKLRPKEAMDHVFNFSCETGLLEGSLTGPWQTATEWNGIGDLSDAVHEHLTNLPLEHENAIVLAAYAALVMLADKNGHYGWDLPSQKTRLVNEINDRLMDWRNQRSENIISDEKFGTWEDWAAFMGLLLEEATLLPYSPYPVERMRREVNRMVARHGSDAQLPARDFWEELSGRMPYLESGRVWNAIRPHFDAIPPFEGDLSFVSSVCLTQLAEDKILDFEVISDAQRGLRLTSSNRVVSAVRLRASAKGSR